jgi:TonB family protein
MKTRAPQSPIVSVTLVLAFALLSVITARAGNLDNVIASEYPNKILTLRHFYNGERLRFYSDGSLIDDVPAGTWTSDSQIEVRDASLQNTVLTIKGRRICQVYDPASKRFIDVLNTIGDSPDKEHRDLERFLRKRQIEIEIQMPPAPDPREIPEALHTIFLEPYEAVAGIVPSFYQEFYAGPDGKARFSQPPAGVFRIAAVGQKPGEITPPHAVSSPDPEYSEMARQIKWKGTAIISLIVDPSGSVRDLQIVEPLGAGLDDKAVAAVSQWKFDPAKKDGKPVPVQISVSVTFNLY